MSEEYSIQVTAQGTPSDIDMMGKLGTLFQNIEKLEISNGLHLVCRVYRVGALELAPPGAKSKKKSKDVGNHRRPFGVAVFDINKYYKQLSDDNTASGEPRWSPPPLNIYTTKNRDAIETLFR